MMFLKSILDPLNGIFEKFETHHAFYIQEQYYTYNQFALYISKVRDALQARLTVSPNIGLVVNDDIETYASIFAIWLEGYAYVPLHPHQPVERSREIIDQAEISLVLDSGKDFVLKDVEIIETRILQSGIINLHPKLVADDSLAYMLFTSGSTGKPKGVMISRGNLGAFMDSFTKTGIQIDEKDRCLQCFDLTFDVSVQSFLVPLIKGACVYTIPHDQIKYSYVYGLLEDHQLTFGAMAPSMIRYLRPYFDEIRIPGMRYNIVTAEASPLDLLLEWSECIPNAEIYDFYGPTEATIYCTYHKFNREGLNKQLNGMLSIGKPMDGLNAIIIDDEGNILGKNQKGELCISGNQLTPGYWKNPEKNRDSFFEKEVNGSLIRYYKTGDSCFFDDEGDIMLAGRLDYQVKIQGYRIELGEVEYHAREFLKGQNAIAVPVANQLGNTEIVLFVEGFFSEESELVAYLQSKMPYYMMPSRIMVEPTFALNTSGKVDRIKLKSKLS
ncbi:MAG: AMP-binding protein [Bacteroidota bacterium]